jgi:hypothetical protein
MIENSKDEKNDKLMKNSNLKNSRWNKLSHTSPVPLFAPTMIILLRYSLCCLTNSRFFEMKFFGFMLKVTKIKKINSKLPEKCEKKNV